MLEVVLSSSVAVAPRARLREPCAREELLTGAEGPVALTAWFAELVEGAPDAALGKPDIWRLSVADRDRIVARAQRAWFGDRIESAVVCKACGEAFELSFSLQALLEFVQPSRTEAVVGPDARGVYSLADGRQFRLPTPDDERALEGCATEVRALELAKRCLVAGDSAGDRESLELAMAALAPLLDLDLPARCALCGSEQRVHFDMLAYFGSSLGQQRNTVLYELHRLASAYHWSWAELLALPRSVRRAQAALIDAERRPGRTP
jgi:hypothetical protein